MEIQAAFAVALRKIRKARKKTQEDFGLVSSRTYLSMLERGLRSPTLNKIDELARVMDVHPLTLVMAAYLEQHRKRPTRPH